MICPNCGRDVPEGSLFCTTCGKNFDEMVHEATPRYAVREKAMEIMGGPMFIVACICTLVSFLCSVVSWFAPDYMTGILYQTGLLDNSVLSSIFYKFSNFMVLIKIIFNIPAILEAIGVAILLAKVKSPHKNGGFVLIKIGLIMQLVSIAIIAAIVAIVMLVALFAGAATESSEVFAAVLIGVVLIVAVFVFIFAYMKGLISTVGIAKDAVSDNKCVKKPSMFVVVVNFMSVGSNLCSLIFCLTMALGMFGSNALVFVIGISLPQLLNIITLLMFSITMIKGRCLVDVAKESAISATSYERVPEVDMTGTLPITEAKRCSYCGKLLRDGEICDCQTVTEPAAPASFCTECGKPLSAGEVCSCKKPAATAPEYIFCTECGKPLRRGEICNCKTTANKHFCTNCGKVLYGDQICDCLKPGTAPGARPGLRSTMRAPKVYTPEETAARSEGQAYFGQAGDL